MSLKPLSLGDAVLLLNYCLSDLDLGSAPLEKLVQELADLPLLPLLSGQVATLTTRWLGLGLCWSCSVVTSTAATLWDALIL